MFFDSMIELFSKGLGVMGAINTVIGVVSIASGFKEKVGTEMHAGIATLIAGAMIAGAAVYLKSVSF